MHLRADPRSKAPHAAVLIDEAYFEFQNITALPWLQSLPQPLRQPHLLESLRHGGHPHRLSLLTSENIAHMHKAQSPYSVNMLAAVAAKAAVQDVTYVNAYVAEALQSRKRSSRRVWKNSVSVRPEPGEFHPHASRQRAAKEIRDALRGHAILTRDRSYEIPGGLRITLGTVAQTESLLRN